MEKREIVSVLEEIGTLLELKGENPFKIRAYQSGARALESLGEDLDQLIGENRLASVNGIGKALVEKITTLRETGELKYHDDLKASVPAGLLEMLEIPGFGPKKIKKVHEELGVETIADLTRACEEGRVAGLSGFGKKSEEKILSGIRNREAYRQRHLWWEAEAKARPVLAELRELPDVIRAEAAGSLRRGKETVGDLDFIVSAENPKPIMEWFTSMDDIQEVSAHGETKSSVRFTNGIQADIRVVPDDRFVFALHHFTGSKDHNVKMRQRALGRGYSLSEWGLFKKGDEPEESGKAYDRPLAVEGVKEEKDLFEALGLHWILPELREGRDELERAEAGELPALVEEDDIRGIFHNHTTATDGRHTLEEMAAAAADRGWEYLGIADHSKASFQANGLDEDRLRKQIESIRRYNDSKQAHIRVLAGCEVDILKDGRLDLPDELINGLDYVVLSVHTSMSGMSEKEMTERIEKAMRAGIQVPKILGHPTGRLLLKREGYAVDLRRVVEVAAETGTIIELNANPHRLDLDWRFWPMAKEAGVLCAINPDAHEVKGYDYMKAGVLTARKGGLERADVVNTRNLKELGKVFPGWS